MPFFDRLWWLQTLAAVLLLAFGAAIIAGYFVSMYPLEEELGEGHMPFLAIALVLAAVFVVLALVVAERSFRAQERRRRRRIALAGDVAAMPLSRIVVDAAQAPDVTHEPLVVMWRPRTGSVIGNRILLALFIFASLVVLGIAALVLTDQPNPDPYDGQFQWLPPLLFTLELGLIGIVTLQELPKALGTRTGITASAAGVTWRTPWRRQRFLRWQDARLLEVIPTGKLDLAREYILYGDGRRFVRWQDYGNDIGIPGFPSMGKQDYIPDGISHEEMDRRIRAVQDLVVARTELVPRTLHRGLQPPDVIRLPRPGASASRAPLLVMGLLLLGLGVASALFPPIALDKTIDLVSALALVLAGCLCLFFALLFAPLLAREQAQVINPEGMVPPTLPSHLFLQPGEAYILPLGIAPFVGRSIVLGGALLTVGGIPGYLWLVAWMAAFFTPIVSGVSTPPPWDGETILGLVLVSFGIFGLMLLGALGSGRLSGQDIRADSAGLHLRLAGLRRDVPWDRVESLTLVTSDGRPQVYRVGGNSGKTDLGWPARPSRWSHPPRVGQPISPSALATLVVQQSGVQLTTADENRMAPTPAVRAR
jgi:hypothetical protein